jgi:hypothetical protein
MAKTELFHPDLKRHLYTITIEVHVNANVFGMTIVEDGYNPTTQEMVGALEIVKMAYMREHGAKVKEAFTADQQPNDNG